MKIVSAILVAFCCVTGLVGAEEAKDAPPLPEARKNVEADKAIVLDVRERNEYEKDHLKNARNVPLSELKEGKIPTDLPKDKTIYTHCMKGGRAAEASKILNEKGYDSMPMRLDYETVKKGFETQK